MIHESRGFRTRGENDFAEGAVSNVAWRLEPVGPGLGLHKNDLVSRRGRRTTPSGVSGAQSTHQHYDTCMRDKRHILASDETPCAPDYERWHADPVSMIVTVMVGRTS